MGNLGTVFPWEPKIAFFTKALHKKKLKRMTADFLTSLQKQ